VDRRLLDTTVMMKTIVVATDFSADADAALNTAVDMAVRDVSHIEIVHVAQPGTYVLPPPFDIVSLPVGDREMTHVSEALELRAQRARTAHVSVATQLRTGSAHDQVVEAARELGASLIVIGTHGAGALASVLVGSVAARIIRHAPCPVLVIPPRR
jgi:nucleotide-binding universal stress UspA family protein